MAYAACAAAVPTGFDEGAVGAGTGATVGKVLGFARSMKGGFGCAEVVRGPVRVAAMAVVNALGDVRDATGHILAGARAGEDALADGAFTDVEATLGDVGAGATREGGALQNTTLCVVATNVALDRVQLAQLARIASGALFRRITPVATSSDGDTIFAVAPLTGIAAPPLQVEVLAVRALEHAIERAVRLAHGRDGVPGVADSQVAA